jgi:hypothetical protein
MRISPAVLGLAINLVPGGAAAQTADPAQRAVVFAELGYARTWDDEGLLGTGAGLAAGAGFRLTPRVTLQAIVERIPYYRDAEHLTFDGRVLFVGAEAAFQTSGRIVRPFATIGAGLMMDDGVWIRKSIQPARIDPQTSIVEFTRIEERVERDYRLSAMTASGGLDVAVSERISIRAGVRFHGLLDTGDDLAPHTIIQPFAGVAWRW